MKKSKTHNIFCDKCDKNIELENFTKNPGRILSNVFSKFYNVYTDKKLDKLFIELPKICQNKIKFTTFFFPDKKKNSYSNSELDNGDLYIPELLTDSDYSFAGRNIMSFTDNNADNPLNPVIHLVVHDLQYDYKNNSQLYDGFNHTFSPEITSCCFYYINFLPYVTKQICLRYYNKFKIIINNFNTGYDKIPSFQEFEKLLSIEITQIRVFSMNIQINAYVRLTELSYNPLPINELISFYIVILPETPMESRRPNNNIGYFTVNNNITRLWLNNQKKIYLDPSVSTNYKDAIINCIEQYNNVFEPLINIRPFKLITMEDPDFPDDYDKHDLRYSRICSASNVNSSYTGLTSTIVDGRSGEILWFQILVQTESITDIPLVSTNNANMKISVNELFNKNLSKIINNRQLLLSKINKPCCTLYDKVRLSVNNNNFISYFKNIIMHEFGHCLGLRHNFAGSLNGNTDINGSIMDYPPIIDDYNTISVNDIVNITTLGSYDVMAIQYGYSVNVPELSDVPLYLTDEDMEYDPRCSKYDNGDLFEWADNEYALFTDSRTVLLDSVTNNIITNWEYTNLYLIKYIRLIKCSLDIMIRYMGSHMINIDNQTASRVECYKALNFIMKFIGQYKSDIVADSQLSDNTTSYCFNPTSDEIKYFVGSNKNTQFPINVVSDNIDTIIFSNLLDINRLNRMSNLEVNAEISNTKYDDSDLVTLAPYMSIKNLLFIIAFSPGIALGNIDEFPNLTKGEPYLYLPFDSTYRLRFTNSYMVSYCGIYLEDYVMPPYPLVPPPGIDSLIQEPLPIVMRGLFPEIILSGDITNSSGLSGIKIRNSYFEPILVNMPYNLMKRRILFLNILNDIIPYVNDYVRNIIYQIVDTIATIYDINNNISIINKLQSMNGTTDDISHCIAIYDKCVAIKTNIFINIQNVQKNNILSNLFLSSKKLSVFPTSLKNLLKKK